MQEDPYIGKKLGNFLIQKKVGAGGMGTVYRAIQEGLDRPVAIKVLKGGRRNVTFLKRFIREAKSAAQISHPNVVQVYTAGVADEVHYIAMEFLEGASIGELLDRRGRFKENEIISIAKQAASGLQAAARRGLVHRDVKPDNLILDKSSIIKVADFGLAKDTESESRLTEDKVTLGTIAYMSPEQIRGGKVDLRSDIYSLGATMFHMASGRPPFLGEGAVVLAYKHLNEPPSPLRTLNPLLSEGLEAVIHRMMAKEPEKRHQTYEEVLDDLIGLATSGAPTSSQTFEYYKLFLKRAETPVRSRRFLAVVLTGIVALAGAVLLLAHFLGDRGDSGGAGPESLRPFRSPSGLVIETPREGAILPSPRVSVKGRANPLEVFSLEINGANVPLVGGRFAHEVWLDALNPRILIVLKRRDNEPETKVIAVNLDVEPPRIVIEVPMGGVLHTRESSATVSGLFLDDHPETLRVDGAAVQVKENRFQVEVPLPEEGEKRLLVEGADRAGHRTTIEVVLVKDLTQPKIELYNFKRHVEGGDGILVFGFHVDEPLSRLAVNGRALPTGRKSYEMRLALKVGVNEVRFEATDLAGNVREHVEHTTFRHLKPPTPEELRKEYNEIILTSLELAPAERVRFLERYIATHPDGPFNRAAQEHIQTARKQVKEKRDGEALETARRKAAEAEDPFAAIAIWKTFLEERTGPPAQEARRILKALRVQGLVDGVERADEPRVYINTRDGAEMVRVVGGKFLRGLPPAWGKILKAHYSHYSGFEDEVPPDSIQVDEFFAYRFEVTNAQFARFLEEHGSEKDREDHLLVREHEFGLVRRGGVLVPAPGRAKCPVVCVSWYGAMEYAKWAGGRLPTEAEWEKAASWDEAAREKRMFPWGAGYREGVAVCADLWFGEEILSETQMTLFLEKKPEDPQIRPQPVPSRPEGNSPCGCFHMAGNVFEWCLDVYDREFYRSRDSRCSNPCRFRGSLGSLRSVRGGSWSLPCRDARTTNRAGRDPSTLKDYLGFRVVR